MVTYQDSVLTHKVMSDPTTAAYIPIRQTQSFSAGADFHGIILSLRRLRCAPQINQSDRLISLVGRFAKHTAISPEDT